MKNLIKSQLRRWLIGFLAVILIIVGVYLLRARSGDAQSALNNRRSGPRAQDVPVVTAAAKTGDMNVYLNGLGFTVSPTAGRPA